MGAKDSKRACLSYEDAVKRMSDVEYKRVCEAFKRLTGGSLLLNKQAFVQNVLGEGVPVTIAEWLYTACGGGPRGISQRELICGLVLLTKGTQEEKIKFLWTLYSNDSGNYLSRSEFQSALQIEGTLPPNSGNKPNLWWDRTVLSLFRVGQDRVGFEDFRAWIQYNKEATVLSKWLLTRCCVTLSSELETPTFYQTLAGVTHLEEQDIGELEKCFWTLTSSANSGQLDLPCISSLVSPPVPTSACYGLFIALDVNGDGHVDFKELCCGISAACRGPAVERLKFCFKTFDIDQDGFLNPTELKYMIDTLLFIAKENKMYSEIQHKHTFSTLERRATNRGAKTLFGVGVGARNGINLQLPHFEDTLGKHIDSLGSLLSPSGSLSQEDFLIWSVNDNPMVSPLLELLFEVCHVSLGLKPLCRHHEYEIVMGWLSREEYRGYRVGQFWYLISSEWWQTWLNYTTASRGGIDHCSCRIDNRVQIEEGVICDESFTSTSTDYNSSNSNESVTNLDSLGDLLAKGDSYSIASSSGVSSGSGNGTKKAWSLPGPIDNSNLVNEPTLKVQTLTGEGGRLKRDTPLVQHRDFELVPDSLWKALALWYGGQLPLPRQVILPPDTSEVELELYPLNLKILRHQAQQLASTSTWSTVVGGYGAAALSTAGITTSPVMSPRRYVAHTAAFSRLANIRQVIEFLSTRLLLRLEDIRLWHVKDTTVLLDDENASLESLGIQDNDQILLEVRNKDLTWPEELGALASGVNAPHGTSLDRRPTLALPSGATGLHNLGNTCFMNAALQAVSNTRPLTLYFQRDLQLCELNTSNPLGTRGQVARRYAELCRELWAGSTRSVAPLKLRWCVTKHAPHLGGGGQHDSQELLAWLLDSLHEDLNRVAKKQYTELRDSDGRPDTVVAQEAWTQHLARDHSVITDLFYGQLKSKVTCQSCGHESVRFDPFNLLSLPLPMESYILCEVLVLRLSGDTPFKYGLRLNSEAKYLELKQQLQQLCDIGADRLLLAEVASSQIKQVLSEEARINPLTATELYAYELPAAFETGTEEEIADSDGVGAVSHSPLARSPESQNMSGKKIESLPARLSTVSLGKQSRCTIISEEASETGGQNYVVAVHRKCIRQESYFLSQHKSKPGLFGIPLLLGCTARTTCQSVYEAVWTQVTRLLSPLPQSDQTNHAMDCDDSLGYEFPFTLKTIMQNGQMCSKCHWTQFCRGCSLPCDEALFYDMCHVNRPGTCIAIDWDPTALHLRYQSSREKIWQQHESVASCRRLHTEPIDLDYCLKAFTSEESLETKYHCSKCQDKQPATKKLQIWRLPPILIIHLKRFDYVNNKWVKTQKVVNFPFKNFDPTAYLASVPQETILRHRNLEKQNSNAGSMLHDPALGEEAPQESSETTRLVQGGDDAQKLNRKKIRERLISTSLQKTPIDDKDLKDFHEHKLLNGQDPFDLKYQLYSVVSHSGLLNGGHYICYSCNPNGHWYCYNDSSCREIPAKEPLLPLLPSRTFESNNNELKYGNKYAKAAQTASTLAKKQDSTTGDDSDGKGPPEPEDPADNDSISSSYRCSYSRVKVPKMDTSTAYILFYERSGLDYKPYLPDVVTNGQAVPEVELEETESELRKQLCSLQ